MNLGFTIDHELIIEGKVDACRIVEPPPVISPCRFTKDTNDLKEGPNTRGEPSSYIFREDFFDPKIRLRRGRVYKAWDSQPKEWSDPNGNSEYALTYSSYSIWSEFVQGSRKGMYFLLGDKQRFTVWKVIDIEIILSGEEMITLRALSTFGMLPELLPNEIPIEARAQIEEALEKVSDEAYVASPDSVVDCCREAAVSILSAYTGSRGDLGSLIKVVDQAPHEKKVAASSASIINRFHPRRKPDEQARRGLRRLTEEDAQYAMHGLSNILVEIGWARW